MTHPTDTQVPEILPWEAQWKKANIRHFMQETGDSPGVDGVVWVAAEDVNTFITELLERERKADHAYLAEEVEKLRRTDETQMSDDHVYDEAIADVLTIITGKE